eukprot:CAMPEP_0116867272 /NCGR_PEP_ID=MMETSP0418-20121206/26523_1 /TAXON_ID=1158023 /ORGANISM="Astrosyne radiata, Strain 13vi08-1A" /LENGTH=207 /DNA_ID=CAMNT_0004503061 /DNA_START=129 /DNA_END=752 /DNA_ORIENTATION=+
MTVPGVPPRHWEPVVLETSTHAVEGLYRQTSATLGAEFNVAVGPVGRGATSHISSSSLLQPAYAYAHSQGLFVGMSLEGALVRTRTDLNTKFYGKPVEVQELLHYREPPRAAQPLYDALYQAMQISIPPEGFRPSQMWDNHCTRDTAPSPAVVPVQEPPVALGMQNATAGYASPVLSSNHAADGQYVTVEQMGPTSLFDSSPATHSQ